MISNKKCHIYFSEPAISSKGWLVCKRCQDLVLPTTNGTTQKKDLDQYNEYGTEVI